MLVTTVDSGSTGRMMSACPVATRGHSSDEQMMLSRPSLLGSTVATDGFCLSLLCYRCSDVVVVMEDACHYSGL
jgi:hypothetical protein